MDINDWTRIKEQASDIGKEQAKGVGDPGREAVENEAKKQGKEAIDQVGRGRSVGRSVREAIGDTVHAAPGEIKDAFGKIVQNPYKHGVRVVKDAAGDLVMAALEHVGWIRDSKWLAKVLNVGVAPRLSEAMEAMKAAIDKVPNKLTEVQVSVYGCDWGAGMARAFLNDLCKASVQGDAMAATLQWQLKDGRRVPLRLMFVGLFDALGYRADSWTAKGVSLIPLIGLKNEVADAMELPRAVERAAHFVAGHEVFNRAHSLGGANLQPLNASVMNAPPRVERIFPGTTWDISGAYKPGLQGRSNGIGLVCLQEMWRLARVSGVPFDGLDLTKATAGPLGKDFDLAAQAPTRRVLSSYLVALQRLGGQVTNLQKAADAMGMMGGNALAKELLTHRMLYVAWLSDLVLRHPAGSPALNGLAKPARDCWQQGAVDFSRLILKDRSKGLLETRAGIRVNPLTDYEEACYELFRLTAGRLKKEQGWSFGPTSDLFGQMLHLPVDQPEADNAYVWQPNLSRLLRERGVDDGEDLRQPTFMEKLRRFAETHLGFKPVSAAPLFDSEQDERNRRQWDMEAEQYRRMRP